MTILIIGGLGYVGGRLANYLRSQNYQQIYLSTIRDSYPPWAEAFDIHHIDLTDPVSIDLCLRKCKPDMVIHLGALQQADCQANPDLAAKINERGTENLVRLCVDHGVGRFIYFSTFQIYGDFVGTITEETSPKPKSVYAKSKYSGEVIVRKYKSSDFHTLILRLSNAYGYPADDQVAESVWTLAANAFCRRAIEQGGLLIKSNQFRDFIAMQDVLEAVTHFVQMPTDTWSNGVFNLGGENCLSIMQLAERIARIYPSITAKSDLQIEGPTEDRDVEFEAFTYSIDKLKSSGFELSGAMDEELKKTLEFCQAKMGNIQHG